MRTIAIASLAVGVLAAPTPAQDFDPVGTWVIQSNDSRYDVTLCGEDGTQLCGRLIWLGNGAETPDNLPYLGTLLIDHALKTGPNQWQGDLHIYGQTASGTIRLTGDDTFVTTGCILFVICRDYTFYRVD